MEGLILALNVFAFIVCLWEAINDYRKQRPKWGTVLAILAVLNFGCIFLDIDNMKTKESEKSGQYMNHSLTIGPAEDTLTVSVDSLTVENQE